MITEQQIDGGWNELKGKAKQKWGQLNDDELSQFEGQADEFIGLIQRKTGEAYAEVESWFNQTCDDCRPYYEQAVAATQEYAQNAAAAAGDTVDHVRQQVAAGHHEAEELVRRRPTESIAVAFGAGIIAGVVVGLMTRSR
ncbi:hypothetical protein Mal64_15000 [Pseudobythopirellula maris]|uniref:CsbD-like domain-containing protein n=1 Tax=Pseudobythopirellula maris TaxID=2527991 RepID=A0A5C5ZVV6_9BACT|nr:CsbD family protein [Pseudobythopirellula maris]TWT91101.1 hypothetical protein Mal64_15000 [Pseudobythopirellula maris]